MKIIRGFIYFIIVAVAMYYICTYIQSIYIIVGFILLFTTSLFFFFRNFKRIIKTQEFVIKKGRHYANGKWFGLFNFRILKIQNISFKFEFDKSAIYQFSENNGWNKLMGFKNGIFGIHKNSARLGWRCEDGIIRICSYCYIDGIRKTEYLPVEIKLNKKYECDIIEHNHYYYFRIKNNGVDVYSKEIKYFHITKGVRYMSFPYFGGVHTAPHNIRIKLKY